MGPERAGFPAIGPERAGFPAEDRPFSKARTAYHIFHRIASAFLALSPIFSETVFLSGGAVCVISVLLSRRMRAISGDIRVTSLRGHYED